MKVSIIIPVLNEASTIGPTLQNVLALDGDFEVVVVDGGSLDNTMGIAGGMARIVLYDRRPDSPTHGVTQVVYAGDNNALTVLIPAGIAHGYQVLGNEPVMLFYHVTKAYDPKDPDEERIPFDDPEIGFDWSIKNR